MPNYFVKQDFKAPSLDEFDVDGKPLKKKFLRGQFISAKPTVYTNKRGTNYDVVRTNDGFNIPIDNVILFESQLQKTSDFNMADANDKVEEVVNKDFVHDLIDVSQKSMKGVTIGAFSGFAYALLKGHSLIWCGLIGGVSGGLIGHYLGTKK